MEEFINQKEEQKELTKYSLRELITGNVLKQKNIIKQLPFVIFIVMLAILYIANRYHAEYLFRKTAKLQEQLNEARAESISIASKLMSESRQTQVLKLVEANKLGLKEATVPPKRVKMIN